MPSRCCSGSRLAALDDVEEFLALCADEFGQELRLTVLEDHTRADDFRRAMGDAWRRRRGLTVLVVPRHCTWDDRWVTAALREVVPKNSKVRFLRVLFIGDPAAAWDWTQRAPDRHPTAADRVEVHTLRPWSESLVARWMNDTELGHLDGVARGRIARHTGNWGRFLHDLGNACRLSPHAWERHLTTINEAVEAVAAEWQRARVADARRPRIAPVRDLEALDGVTTADFATG